MILALALSSYVEFKLLGVDAHGQLDTGASPRLGLDFGGWYLRATTGSFRAGPFWTPNLAAGLYASFDDKRGAPNDHIGRYIGPFLTHRARWTERWGSELDVTLTTGYVHDHTESTTGKTRTDSTSESFFGGSAEFLVGTHVAPRVEFLAGPGRSQSEGRYKVRRETDATATAAAKTTDSNSKSSVTSSYLYAVVRADL